jgi:hypothetical protein
MPVTQQEIDSIMGHFADSKAEGRCAQCGFEWSVPVHEARSVVTGAPARCAELIGSRWDAARRKPDEKTWSPNAYVWHCADAIGIWAERLKALAEDASASLAGFDQDDLAAARRYEEMSPQAGLWAFERRVRDWDEAVDLHDPTFGLSHPDFGSWDVGSVVRWMAHDLYHHQDDIARGLET